MDPGRAGTLVVATSERDAQVLLGSFQSMGASRDPILLFADSRLPRRLRPTGDTSWRCAACNRGCCHGLGARLKAAQQHEILSRAEVENRRHMDAQWRHLGSAAVAIGDGRTNEPRGGQLFVSGG